jgi:hypothetical protein
MLAGKYQRFDDSGALMSRVKQPIDKAITHFRNVSNYIFHSKTVKKTLGFQPHFLFLCIFKRVRTFLNVRVFIYTIITDT